MLHGTSGHMAFQPSALLETPQQTQHRTRFCVFRGYSLQERHKWRCKAEGKPNDALSERLKAAENEASQLRKQLEAARAARSKEVLFSE